MKPSTANGGTVTTPSGWTLRESLTGAGGYGTTLGADTGNTNLWIYTKDTVTGAETGNLTVTVGTNNVSWGLIVRIPGGGGTSFTYGTADGSRTTAPTSGTAFTTLLTNGATAPNLQNGDVAIWAMCIPTDVLNNGFTAPTISSTGTTFGTAVELEEPDSGTGNDIGGYVAYAIATAGSSTAAPTVGVTATGTVTNVRGPIALIRVRDTSQTLTPTLYTNDQTFYTPTVTPGTVTLTPDLYTNVQTFYSPDVTQTGGVQNLDPSLYTNTQVFYDPTVTATYTLTPDLYTNTQTFFTPTVTATYDLAPALYTNTQTFYSADVTQGTTLLPSLYTNTQTFYSATVTAGTVNLQPSLYTNDQTFYAPAVATTYDIAPSLYTNTQSFYSPTVSVAGGAQTLLPDLYTNSQTFFAITLSATYSLEMQDYVDPGYVDPPGYVNWSAFNNNVFFSPSVTQGPAPEPTPQDTADIGPRVRRKRKQREFDDERLAREQLRATIKAAIAPVKDAAQATVLASQQDADAGVAVVAGGRTVSIPVPPEFNAAQVAQMVATELERVNVAVRREAARIELETMIREERARIAKRQREDEEILLFS